MHGREHSSVYSQPAQPRIKKKYRVTYTIQRMFMYAKTKSQNQPYSFRYSLEQTEYDSAKAFERAGANTIVKVFKNLSAADIRDSVDEFVKAINQSQIIMFPGGFSAGDEPEGSAKFFATAFRNAKMTEAVNKLLSERDGLALGICNGFQALIKLGLVPYGQIQAQSADSPTLTYNTINRHISKMVYTKVVTNKSPMAAAGKAWCNVLQPGIPRRGTFRSSEGMAGQAFCKRTGCHPVCQRGRRANHG